MPVLELCFDTSIMEETSVVQPQQVRFQVRYPIVEVDRISASVLAPNVDKWALLEDIRFRLKAVVPHSMHFRFWKAAVGKFGGCRK